MIEKSAEKMKKTEALKRSVIFSAGPVQDETGEVLTFPTECVSENKYIHIGKDTWSHPIKITENYRDMNIPQGLIWMVSHWKNEANIDSQIYQSECFEPKSGEKNARLHFIWFGDYYELPYYVLETTQEHFSCFAYRIVEELQQMGCPYTRYVAEPELYDR